MALQNCLKRAAIYFGKVMNSDLPNAALVRIDKYVMDTRLNMHFKEHKEVYAFNNVKEVSAGDYVIIREIPEEVPVQGRKIKHTVEKLVYKGGYFVDPVSGKKNAGNEYLDDISRTLELFGRKRPY